MRAFIDTNVLVYAVDRAEDDKRRIAQDLLARRSAEVVLSAQVLSELYAVLTRKFRESITLEQAASFVDRISVLSVIAIDADLVRDAITLSREAQLSYWDGLIVAAARESACEVVLTEDLSHGAVIGGVRIENPFLNPS